MTQFSTAEVAEKFDTDTRTLRKFLRADARNQDAADTLPGKGSRYAIEGKAIAPLKKRFTKWLTAQDEAKAAKATVAIEGSDAKVSLTKADAVEQELDELDELEPTDEELDMLEVEDID